MSSTGFTFVRFVGRTFFAWIDPLEFHPILLPVRSIRQNKVQSVTGIYIRECRVFI